MVRTRVVKGVRELTDTPFELVTFLLEVLVPDHLLAVREERACEEWNPPECQSRGPQNWSGGCAEKVPS